jgi:hypothetical protein
MALRISGAVIILLGTPFAVASGLPGTLLVLVVCLAMMLGVREVYSRRDVLVMTGTGIAGGALAGLSVMVAHPQWWLWTAIAVAALTVGIVGIALVSPGPRPALQRVGDTIEVLCVLAVLPLAAFAVGVV